MNIGKCDSKCLMVIGVIVILVVLAFVFLGQPGGQAGGQGTTTVDSRDPFAVGGGSETADGSLAPDFCAGGGESC
ncbi:MAG: hypothetical protein ABH854_03500 [Candidatus Diapherotrites archaeon]